MKVKGPWELEAMETRSVEQEQPSFSPLNSMGRKTIDLVDELGAVAVFLFKEEYFIFPF